MWWLLIALVFVDGKVVDQLLIGEIKDEKSCHEIRDTLKKSAKEQRADVWAGCIQTDRTLKKPGRKT